MAGSAERDCPGHHPRGDHLQPCESCLARASARPRDGGSFDGVQLVPAAVREADEIDLAIKSFAREPNGAVIMFPSIFTSDHRERVVAAAAQYRLPAMYPYRAAAVSGGLISYGIDIAEQFRGAASYVDRILKGEKPGDLPIQAPTKYELVINLKTAKTLGLSVPLTLQASADEVIE
jgi:putative tryptophan/tyrosine transport system substrate-binding protein